MWRLANVELVMLSISFFREIGEGGYPYPCLVSNFNELRITSRAKFTLLHLTDIPQGN